MFGITCTLKENLQIIVGSLEKKLKNEHLDSQSKLVILYFHSLILNCKLKIFIYVKLQ